MDGVMIALFVLAGLFVLFFIGVVVEWIKSEIANPSPPPTNLFETDYWRESQKETQEKYKQEVEKLENERKELMDREWERKDKEYERAYQKNLADWEKRHGK